MLAALALTLLAAQPADAEPARPNVLFILADDLGFGDLSIQRQFGGAEDVRTPHIDSIFQQGLTFRNFYANCTVCSPTRAALMTGRFPSSVGVPGVIRPWPEDNWGYLSPHAPALPELLKPAGYETALIGKWHLGGEPHNGAGNHPLKRGFDTFEGFLGGMLSDYVTHTRRFPDGSDRNMMRRNWDTIDPQGHATDLFSDWSAAGISHAASTDAPFFLYLAYNAPHTPIQPPAEWVEKVKAREAGITDRRAQLVALIEHMDAGVGRVLKALEESGQAENTLVVFTSDNGGHLGPGAHNGPYRGGKEDLYEGGHRVACGARWPGRIAPGTQTDMTAMTMDWFATMLDVAGAEVPPGVDAVSLAPTLRGEEQPPLRKVMHWTRREGRPLIWGGKAGDAVVADGWKLVQNRPYDPLRLFHLAEDPHEQNDLFEERKDKARALAGLMQDRIRRDGAVPFTAPPAGPFPAADASPGE
ncbi:sulfatase family protein [Alienimonas californiensis]|uniref:Arylsulfatase n=1 Tax=Alienimonas californiensis TaxID=2527989 RepID=A0A517PC82_9PLAN|nr:sulfatase-like hydrolase/transferase [Alienimonas californiensis]QDT16984.1 Arylsulfatase [Alienimonas californiensis]